jgi:undecaprenyl-diphosphatase
MVFFSMIGNVGALWLILALSLALTKKYRRVGIDIFISVALCWLVSDLVLKLLVMRPRPFDEIPGLIVLVKGASSYSFPSGHACSSFAAAFVLMRHWGKKGALFYIVAGLISVSRVWVGVHYPSDVLCGALLGTAGSYLFYTLGHRIFPLKKKNY